MFYGSFVLSKKGPLAKVWLAAHWDKKLTKAQVFETDVESTVDSIISPQVKMALRTSGHLLLGVVRIYSRKHKYLINDLSETCAKIKLAFRPGIVDLPPENRVDNAEALTLPEIFHNFEAAIAEIGNADIEAQLTVNPSRASEITMPDTAVTSKNAMFGEFSEYAGGDEFGGGMEDIELARDAPTEAMDGNITDNTGGIQIGDITDSDKAPLPVLGGELSNIGISGMLAEGFGPNDPGMMDIGEMPSISDITMNQAADKEPTPMDVEQTEEQPNVTVGVPDPAPPKPQEEFSLEPLDISKLQKKAKPVRKRKLAIDTNKEFSGDVIRANFDDYDDILQPKCFPPPTKTAMRWKEMATCENLFSKPLSIHAPKLVKLCVRNYKSERPPNAAPVNDLTLEELREPAAVGNNNTVTAQDGDPLADNTKDPTMNLDFNFDIPEEQPFNPEGEHIEQPNEEARIIPEMPDLENLVDAVQQVDELPEDYEQRRWTKRTQQVVKALDQGLEKRESLSFNALTQKANRKQAASRFYSCLLLAKEKVVTLKQDKPFSEITISKGPRFIET